MAKRKRATNPWGINLDLAMPEDIMQSWVNIGVDVEDFFVPEADANAFRVEGANNETDKDEDHECRYVRPRLKPIPRRHVRYEKAAAFARDLGLLQKDERIDSIISGKFIMGDFIEAYMVEYNLHTERLLISTLSYNENNVDSIKNLAKRYDRNWFNPAMNDKAEG